MLKAIADYSKNGRAEYIKVVQEALRKKEVRKNRPHQNDLRRKANGRQKVYEDRIKTEKRRKMEAKKAALRAEDMAKGVSISRAACRSRSRGKAC